MTVPPAVAGSKISSLRGKSVAAQVFLWISAAFWSMEIVTVFAILIEWSAVWSSSWIDVVIRVDRFSILIYLATAVTFLIWSYSAHANLTVLGRNGQRHSHPATIWWWLVPIASLFMPYRVVSETARGSVAPPRDENWKAASSPASFGWWAGLFITGQVLWIAPDLLLDLADEFELFDFAYDLPIDGDNLINSLIGAAALTGAAFAAIQMIKRITHAQRYVWAQMQGGETTPQAAAVAAPQPQVETAPTPPPGPAEEPFWFYVTESTPIFDLQDHQKQVAEAEPGFWFLARAVHGEWVHVDDPDTYFVGWIAASAIKRKD